MMLRSWRWSVLFPLLALTACDSTNTDPSGVGGGGSGGNGGSGGSTNTGGGGSGGAGGSFEVALEWKPCPLDSSKSTGKDAECADVKVPADWGDPGGAMISVFVKRWPILTEPAQHHVWLVQGGPGSASVQWDARVKGIGQSLPGAQFYFQDPRGTGRSTRLGCAAQEAAGSDGGLTVTLAEWPACIAAVQAEQGELLQHFTTSQTARDLGALIQAASGAAARRTVLGQSYGTTLLQRWLHFFPDLATEVVLDSLANPGGTFTGFSEGSDSVGHDYLDLCAQDALCAAKLGPDPSQAAAGAFTAAFDQGACPGLAAAGLDRPALAKYLYALLTFVEYRAIIPPVFHRLARCNAEDVAALGQLHAAFGSGGAPTLDEKLHGQVLYHNIVLSEMWDQDPPTPAEHLETLQTLEFGLLGVELDTLFTTWPKYPAEPLANVYPSTTLPMILMNGSLDAQTPLASAILAKPHYTAASQHFVTVPGAPHGAIGGEPWSQPGPPCSVQILLGFLADPTGPINDACFSLADPVAFEPDAATTQLFFGLSDPWGDGPPPPPAPLPASELHEKRVELQERLTRLRLH